MKTIALFSNLGGVGKTTLAFHLAWMLRHLGEQVPAVDLDPQANLTTAFLEDDDVEALWDDQSPATIHRWRSKRESRSSSSPPRMVRSEPCRHGP